MQIQRLWRYSRATLLLIAFFVVAGGASTVMAVTSSSPNYQVTETQFGSGSSQQSCSGQYCAQVTIGDATDADAPESTASFDEVTGDEPLLEVILEAGESNLGVLTTETTATKTTTVKVRSVLSGGYVLQVMGDAPSFEGYTLLTPQTPSRSIAGTEQFAINVVANTTPAVGRDPVSVPDTIEPSGFVTEGYGQSNLFQYIDEDVVARSVSESGRTDYTISMIVNISSSTPPGNYAGDFAAVVIPSY